jgi:hypothetical protein
LSLASQIYFFEYWQEQDCPKQMATIYSSDQLVAELDRLGVNFVRRSSHEAINDPLEPVQLVAGLASSHEARLRLALIPLLLWRPEYAKAAEESASLLNDTSLLTLQCYYTAAMLLQTVNAGRLHRLGARSDVLPDLFSLQLDLSEAGGPTRRLKRLAKRQAARSREEINWLGTYQHAVESFIHQKEQELDWIP